VIAGVADCAPEKIYYAAAELNGSGVRFYGDICLVLDTVDASTLVLDRNSYDLMRPPMSTQFDTNDGAALGAEVRKISGRWQQDLPAMAAVKVLATPRASGRRMTTGQISEGLLSDEDYVEVILTSSFEAGAVHEARLLASDVANEEHIARREMTGPPPTPTALQWQSRRRDAERALHSVNVPVRVVTETGRVRG
jgi:hypothetical protein